MNVRSGAQGLAAGMLTAALAGCSQTAITGEGCVQQQVVCGAISIMGEDHKLTLLEGSDVKKLSIMGEGNHVFVEDGAVVAKVEIVGEDNEVSCPAGQSVEFSTIGDDNRLRYRE